MRLLAVTFAGFLAASSAQASDAFPSQAVRERLTALGYSAQPVDELNEDEDSKARTAALFVCADAPRCGPGSIVFSVHALSAADLRYWDRLVDDPPRVRRVFERLLRLGLFPVRDVRVVVRRKGAIVAQGRFNDRLEGVDRWTWSVYGFVYDAAGGRSMAAQTSGKEASDTFLDEGWLR
jgi:hypothetical protein